MKWTAEEVKLTLPQAFLFAGARCVLFPVYPTDDEATRALMVRFYELWAGDENDPSAALRQAQAHVRAVPRWAHPYYWGAWVIWGLPP